MAASSPGRELRAARVAGAATLLLVLSDLVPWLRGPAPYPPEWRWELRTPPSLPWPVLAVSAVAAAALAAVLRFSGSAAAARAPRRAAFQVVAAATVVGVALTLGLAAVEPGGPLRVLIRRTVSRTVTSYFTVALSEHAARPAEFVDRHAELLPAFRHGAKHAATHPPGPVLFDRAALGLCRTAPGLCAPLLALAGVDPERGRLAAEDRAAALLAALAIVVGGSLTAWPIAALARRAGAGPLAAARVGALWAVVPGPVLMAPQFDQLLALPVAGAAALLARAVAAPRLAVGPALAAGVVGGLALLLSYGAAAFLAIAGAAALATQVDSRARLRLAALAASIAAAVALVVVLIPMAWGHEPFTAARTALAIHREVFTIPRSYPLWLVFNPLDLAVFLGVPVAVLLVAALVRTARASPRGPADRLRVAALAGLAVLWASGTVRGEVGRIWIPLMPALLVAALVRDDDPDAPRPALAATLAVVLAAISCAIATRWEVG